MVTVESVLKCSGKIYKVLLSNGKELKLYYSDIINYGLNTDAMLTDSEYEDLYHSCVIVRARKKVLSLLEISDNTEAQLRFKLKRAGYDDDVAEDAIRYAASYGYIDDYRAARSYILNHCHRMSRKQMAYELSSKGISPEVVSKLFDEVCGSDSEAETVRRLIAKKAENVDDLSYEDKKKIAAALFRKGFPREIIFNELNMY